MNNFQTNLINKYYYYLIKKSTLKV